MEYFATFDDGGFPVAFYNVVIHGDTIPENATAISETQWQEFTANQGRRRWLDGAVVTYEPPGPSPEEMAIAERLAQFPNLEPDQFWFVMRASGYETSLNDWLANISNPGTIEEPNPDYDPLTWAAASSKLQFAKFFERDHPFVESAREAIGMTEQELDALWEYAAQ